jgi:large subunit ribosomal protein L6e
VINLVGQCKSTLWLQLVLTRIHLSLFCFTQKQPRYYPAEDVKASKPVHKVRQNPPRVRKSITPGTILIILAGRFRGKRVVCLKALESGLLLVSGPYKINGVPLRRVNQAYVIATSTKVDVSKVNVANITDEYFSRTKDAPAEGEQEFFAGDAPKPAVVSDERKADQQKVDAELLKVVAATPMLEGYLAAHFSLTSSDKPHNMKF